MPYEDLSPNGFRTGIDYIWLCFSNEYVSEFCYIKMCSFFNIIKLYHPSSVWCQHPKFTMDFVFSCTWNFDVQLHYNQLSLKVSYLILTDLKPSNYFKEELRRSSITCKFVIKTKAKQWFKKLVKGPYVVYKFKPIHHLCQPINKDVIVNGQTWILNGKALVLGACEPSPLSLSCFDIGI